MTTTVICQETGDDDDDDDEGIFEDDANAQSDEMMTTTTMLKQMRQRMMRKMGENKLNFLCSLKSLRNLILPNFYPFCLASHGEGGQAAFPLGTHGIFASSTSEEQKVRPNSIARHVQCKIKRGSWDTTSWKVHISHVH